MTRLRRLAKLILLAGTALSPALTILPVRPAYPQGIAVHDNASLAHQVAQGAKELGQWAQQIKAMVELLSIQNAMNTLLGEGLGDDFTALTGAAQDLYSDYNGLYYAAVGKPMEIQSQLGIFMPPSGGYTAMSLPQMLDKARGIQRLIATNTARAQLMQSQALERQQVFMKQAAAGGAQADRARSAVGATQALAHIAGAQAAQLQTLNQTVGSLALHLENKTLFENNQGEIYNEQRKRDIENMRLQSEHPGEMQISPVEWGR